MREQQSAQLWITASRKRLIALLLLAPLAYAGGMLLLERHGPLANLPLRVDRNGAAAAARAFAAREGIDASNWPDAVKLRIDNSVRRYSTLHPQGAPEALARLVQPLHWSVLLAPFNRRQGIEVEVGADGRVVGFERHFLPSERLADPGDVAAATLAHRALASYLGADAPLFRLEGSNKENTPRGIARTYDWRRTFEGRPELAVTAGVRLDGPVVSKLSRASAIDPAFLRKQLAESRSTPAQVAIGFAILAIAVFAIYRFVQRAREQEVPYRHAALVGIFLFLGLAGMTYVVTDPDWANTGAGNLSATRVVSALAAVSFAIMGLTLFVAWGGCEGDVREHFPGRLTSIDALLRGRLLSRNVSGSFAIGAALGGFQTLLTGLAVWAGSLAPHFFETIPASALVIVERKYVLLFLVCSLAGSAIALAAHLIMISFVGGKIRSRGALLATLFVCYSVFLLVAELSSSSPLWAALLPAMAAAGGWVIATAITDFLALHVMSVMSGWAGISAVMLSMPAQSFHAEAWRTVAYAATAAVAAAIWMFRARELSESDVRPLYVRNIADRLALQAQFETARQAQLRVLPASAPSFDGATVAASCRPAQEVSGDYYDFFPIDSSRFGFVVADAGSEKLSSALSIALLKGLLVSPAKAGRPPHEIAARAGQHLRNVFGEELPFSFAYALVDTARRTLAFSRIGPVPLLYRARAGSGFVEELGAGGGDDVIALDPGDRVLVLTDGIADALNEDGEAFRETRLRIAVSDASEKRAAELVDSLFRAVERHATGAANDDRTVVVVGLDVAAEKRVTA